MIIKLPVVYEACGVVEIEANSVTDAIEKFDRDLDHIPLPDKTEYVSGSFDLATRDEEYIGVCNGFEI